MQLKRNQEELLKLNITNHNEQIKVFYFQHLFFRCFSDEQYQQRKTNSF